VPDRTLDELRRVYDDLVSLHGWADFRTPRNMALALTGRVGAVAAHLQFAAEGEPARGTTTPELRAELADCLVYLVGLADALGVDVLDEAVARIGAAVEKDTGKSVTG
jgi:NTP pyrophosphatase (non-canonical NTP hydrolase)